MKKEVLIDFIADLIFSIDPLVFAGYGTKYQNEYTECLDSMDPISCLEIEEKYITSFISNNDINELLDGMMDIFIIRPTEYLNNIATRRKDDWDYYVDLVIAKIGNKSPEVVIRKLSTILVDNNNKREAIIEILSFMEVNNSYDLAKKIYETYNDLSESELDMIKEIKEAYDKFNILHK